MLKLRHFVGSRWQPLFTPGSVSNAATPSLCSSSPHRCSSSKTLPTPAVCLSKDGSTFLAYHPQRDFPYEHTRPLPTQTPEEAEYSSSPLKVQIAKAFREKKQTNKLSEKDLEKMFSECRQFFRPQPQERKRKDVAEYERKLKLKTLNELPDD